jgi:hypothetical protein
MMEPSQLLKHLRMVGITLEDPAVSAFCRFELSRTLAMISHWSCGCTNLFLLFVHVPNLEPDIFLGERAGRVGDDVLEALSGLDGCSQLGICSHLRPDFG